MKDFAFKGYNVIFIIAKWLKNMVLDLLYPQINLIISAGCINSAT